MFRLSVGEGNFLRPQMGFCTKDDNEVWIELWKIVKTIKA